MSAKLLQTLSLCLCSLSYLDPKFIIFGAVPYLPSSSFKKKLTFIIFCTIYSNALHGLTLAFLTIFCFVYLKLFIAVPLISLISLLHYSLHKTDFIFAYVFAIFLGYLIKDLFSNVKEVNAINQLKTEFIAKLTHDLRTPLNGIVGFSNLLMDTPLSSNQQDYLSTINFCVKSLCGQIENVLDLAKIEKGELKLDFLPFNLKKDLLLLEKLLSQIAKEKSIKIIFKLDEFPEYVKGDSVRIQQIITNLVNNAIKFSPEKKDININIEIIKLDKDKTSLKGQVIDHGPGISPELQKGLFRPFFTHTTCDNQKKGTGVGLFICKQLVQEMNGEIYVSSEVGKGSTFTFTFDLAIPDSKEIKIEEKENTEIDIFHRRGSISLLPLFKDNFGSIRKVQEKTILLCEDNKVNQALMKKILVPLGYKVDIQENGLNGIECFKKNQYDLVLMDINMPVLNGYEATKQIRAIEQAKLLPRTPIIALTAQAFPEELKKLQEIDMDDFLTKPIDIPLLKKTLLKFIKNSEVKSEDKQEDQPKEFVYQDLKNFKF